MHLIGPTSGNCPKSACVRAYQRIHSEFLCLPCHTSSFCSLSSRGFKDPRLFETDFAYVIVRLRIWRKRCNPPSYRLSGCRGSGHSTAPKLLRSFVLAVARSRSCLANFRCIPLSLKR